MNIRRGEVWLADLNPTRGSEQSGLRPVIVFQNDGINRFTTTVVVIPLTTNLRRAGLPSALLIERGDGGLAEDSAALCHHARAIDTARFQRRFGELAPQTMTALESRILFTFGIL